jgi:glycine/D-amino acid oxidase-like deaminating enzyme
LPAGYRAEAFQPLLRAAADALGEALREAGPDWRIELRAGRILVATPVWSADKPEQLITLGARLTAMLHQVLATPPGAEPEPAPDSVAPS